MRNLAVRSVRWARIVVALALAIGVWMLAAQPAGARAVTVVASEPRSEQTVDDQPGWVTIAFSAPIDDSAAKVIVQGPDGDNVTTGTLIVEGTNVTTQLRDELPQGTYTVHFRVNSAGGGIEGGAFQFAYGSGSFSTPADKKWSGSAHEPAILKGTDPNATTEPPDTASSEPPEVEVEKGDKTETVDPGPSPTSTAPGRSQDRGQAGEEPGTETTGPAATAAGGPTTATSGPGGRLPLIVGGAVVLIAVGAGAVALGLRGRGEGGRGKGSSD